MDPNLMATTPYPSPSGLTGMTIIRFNQGVIDEAHPTKEGYEVMKPLAEKAIKEALKRT
jgi:lysophospholipase L1-like esterase